MAAQTPHPGRKQALDDLIMGTNSSSIVSKRSVERLYHPDEPHFYRYFVDKFQRRSPLINRGYWLRLKAIDVLVSRFVMRPLAIKKVIINLGCGSDVLPWQSHARLGTACDDLVFVDIDYPHLILEKRAVVLQTPQLRDLLGSDFKIGESDQDSILLQSERYCQIGCDLRQLDKLRVTLETLLPMSGCQVLFVAEVSLTYMDTYSADSLIQWASSIGTSEFCLLEQIIPHGPHHPFAETMLNHFNKLNTPPKSVGRYPTLESQRARFQSRGWRLAKVWDLWEVWSDFLSAAERAALDEVEPFDEWEEFMLFARHYLVVHASSTAQAHGDLPSQDDSIISELTQEDTEAELEVTCHQEGAPRRRFGEAMVVPDPMGAQFAVHMMGIGTKGRTDTYDIYSLGQYSKPPRLPLTGPIPRMCHTVTDIGDFGILLVGGRGSPATPFSDCWLFRKGTESCWQSTWRLPVPLFRHSAIRLAGSSLALVLGGKTGPSKVSEDCFVFHPERGWLKCRVVGVRPRPSFGAVVCNLSRSRTTEGIFHGLLAGGIGQDGRITSDKYSWCLDSTEAQPTIKFEAIALGQVKANTLSLSLFGARCMELGSCTLVCGGMGEDASFQGRHVVAVTMQDNGSYKALTLGCKDGAERMPFMIGSSIVPSEKGVVVVGGGATCFSMGTFWDQGVYSLTVHSRVWQCGSTPRLGGQSAVVRYLESRKVVSSTDGDSRLAGTTVGKATVVTIPRVRLGPERSMEQVVGERRPVVIEGLDMGNCLQKWTPDYMVERVGGETSVIVHRCHNDTEKMDFNSKNFGYISDSFGNMMAKMQAGGRLYLRSLSRDRPSEQPANMERDFPRLAQDFGLPVELDCIREKLFSSILRVSGRVNMWLHYDVMANVYTQIMGRRHMVVFPPSDVRHLSLAPGASSSSLDVFTMLDAQCLAATHPHEAQLGPGDVLFLPALWLHTATSASDMSVAVNVFFRDLGSGYAAGRDVYGNRDLAAYEKGRRDAARIAGGFQGLPLETRRFYLARIADELEQAAEGA